MLKGDQRFATATVDKIEVIILFEGNSSILW